MSVSLPFGFGMDPTMMQPQAQQTQGQQAPMDPFDAMLARLQNKQPGSAMDFMAAFYGVPYYYRAGDSSQPGTMVQPGNVAVVKPGRGNLGGTMPRGNGNGGTGGGTTTPVIPPVTPPTTYGPGTVPGINGNTAYQDPTLLYAPPVGSGSQWRSTMKNGV